MDQREIKLEEISNKVNSYKSTKHPPVFEMYVTLFSILTAVILFLFPDMLQPEVDGISNLYWLLLSIMPQYMWALTFFVAGITKSIGMLIGNNASRMIGLLMSAVIYAVFAICYTMSFPTIGSIVFVSMTIFTLVSLPMV